MGHKNNFPQVMREAGFKLRQYRDGPLDWRQMGSYETERILREQNLEVVDDALKHLSEAPLGTMLETHILDGGIAKYFVMSQYAIQYLLCCRTYLDETVDELREAHEISQQEIAKLRKSLSESNNEVVQLHKKITQIETIREVVFPCHLCTKNFISNEALNVHIGRKHRVGTPSSNLAAGGTVREKENDMQLINTIKMELEIKQLKERLNAAERNIKERSGQQLQDQTTSTMNMRHVGIQSNLGEYKEKDEVSMEAAESEASERKEQLHGLAERLSSFEAWQAQLKQSNEDFIRGINQKLEDLTLALEQTKRNAESKVTAPATAEERVATPCLEDLERILTEKVAEIGKVSANKLEEVVHQLEMGYKEKLEALERDLKRLSLHKQPVAEVQQAASASKIPKPLPKKEESMERIKRLVETEFLKTKRDDDTYSIEKPPPQPEQQAQKQEQASGNSSSSHPTYTKQAPASAPARNEPKPKAAINQPEQPEQPEATDISESLSGEESISDEGSEVLTSEPERQVFMSPKIKSVLKNRLPPKPLTRKDARKLINQRLNPHGFNMKSKAISNTSAKRVSAELAQQRARLKLDYPNFYTTRNRIRKFVEKLCSVKMPERAQILLKNKTPLQPMEVPKRRNPLLTTTDDDDDLNEGSDVSSASQEMDNEKVDNASTSSKAQQPNFKAQLEQLLAKPAAHVVSKPNMVQLQQAKPVPLPRKRVMFNTGSSRRSSEDNVE
ncbi:zinc finger protein DZIP1 [Drosophila mojavensis]|uniref:zinc finger protein DZIP1 n=1 Tax=Drosophila mojavensis TaxID=7230 RepID=UPI001CD0E860|nr:zinc finger protein DZIP1 [Drosophila mojavensis]